MTSIAHNNEGKRRARLAVALLVGLLASLIAVAALERPASAEIRLVEDRFVTVPGTAGDVDTGIDLQTGDRMVFNADGLFNPGCFLCGDTGPEGYTFTADNRFPLPGVREYSLLGKVNGNYFHIGTGSDTIHQGGPGRLFLRINDFQLSDNRGSYRVHIQIFRDVPENTCPTIGSVTPADGSKTKKPKPTISATVQDQDSELVKANIRIFVDGNEKTNFNYDGTSDKLTYKPAAKLKPGRHSVSISATDSVGCTTTENWSFKVVKKRR
jgi:hypothetical protein